VLVLEVERQVVPGPAALDQVGQGRDVVGELVATHLADAVLASPH
jgi:hypothetical protein